jgi:hypothetical protein
MIHGKFAGGAWAASLHDARIFLPGTELRTRQKGEPSWAGRSQAFHLLAPTRLVWAQKDFITSCGYLRVTTVFSNARSFRDRMVENSAGL